MRKIWIGLVVIILIVFVAYGLFHARGVRGFQFVSDYIDNLQQFKEGQEDISNLVSLRDQMRRYSSNRNKDVREAAEMMIAGYDEMIDALKSALESPERLEEAYGKIFQSSISAGRILILLKPVGSVKPGRLRITSQEREQLEEKIKVLLPADRYNADWKDEKIAGCRDIFANILHDPRYKARDE